MKQAEENQPALPRQRAFVVQFRVGDELQAGQLAGRVEHVLSGRYAPFHSIDELEQFLRQVLTETTTEAHR